MSAPDGVESPKVMAAKRWARLRSETIVAPSTGSPVHRPRRSSTRLPQEQKNGDGSQPSEKMKLSPPSRCIVPPALTSPNSSYKEGTVVAVGPLIIKRPDGSEIVPAEVPMSTRDDVVAILGWDEPLLEEAVRFVDPPDRDPDGECGCTMDHIMKDSRDFDYSTYSFHKLYYECAECGRRPATWLCMCCFVGLCSGHVESHHKKKPEKCTLYVNSTGIMEDEEKSFWCELHKRYHWKHVEIHEPLVDQLIATKGVYADEGVKDIWMRRFITPEDRPAAFRFAAVLATVQGWRATQEDAETFFHFKAGSDPTNADVPGVDIFNFVVLDGHGGDQAARAINKMLPVEAVSQFNDTFGPGGDGDVSKALKRAFIATDARLNDNNRENQYGLCGCTGVVVSIKVSHGNDVVEVHCASAGDSRACVRLSDGTVIPLSEDHKLMQPTEKDRVIAAGYTISGLLPDGTEDPEKGGPRIEGMLAVPRAFGDFDFKQCGGKPAEEQAVTVNPDTTVTKVPVFRARGAGPSFILSACDGIWDVATCEEACAIVQDALTAPSSDDTFNMSPRQHNGTVSIARRIEVGIRNLVDHCMATELTESGLGLDNMSVCVVLLNPEAIV